MSDSRAVPPAARLRVKRSMHAFPAAPSFHVLGGAAAVGRVAPSGDGGDGGELRDRQWWLRERAALYDCVRRLRRQRAMAPLHLPGIMGRALLRQQPQRGEGHVSYNS